MKIRYVLAFALLLLAPRFVSAATLGIAPASISKSVGSTFTVTVYASSADQSMNAASGVVSFPPSLLEVTGVSKANSIISLWVQDPTFSNDNGTLRFEGIAFNPGYTGTQGALLSVTFRVKSAGKGSVAFTSGSVLANDGSGSNILKGMSGATVTGDGGQTQPQASVPAQTPTQPQTTPATEKATQAAIVIRSSTHPDQSKWYSNNQPELSWSLPPGTLEVRTLIGSSPRGVPMIKYAPPITQKKVDPLPDGTYYFSLQARTSAGWGEVSRYRVNVDTTPPEAFTVKFPHGSTVSEPQPVLLFNTTDTLAGISHYNVKVGSAGYERVAPVAISNPYPLPPQEPGKHRVLVTAVDEAGNEQSASAEFEITGIQVPKITTYTEELDFGDIPKIRGVTYPESDVAIYIRDAAKLISTEYTRSNSSGDFGLIVAKRLDPGDYTFTAQVTDGRGAQSAETEPKTILVKSKFWLDVSNIAVHYLGLVILGIILLAAFIVCMAYFWHSLLRKVRRVHREGHEAERMLGKRFLVLRKQLLAHIIKLKKSRVNSAFIAQEILFLEEFEQDMESAQQAIAKEINDISET